MPAPPRTTAMTIAEATLAAVDMAAAASEPAPRFRSERAVRVSLTAPSRPTRWTPASDLVLIPIESLATEARHTPFAIDPPWRKPVYSDPEDEGT